MTIEKRGSLPPPLEESVPKEIFKSEVYAWAERVGVQPQSITIRRMEKKWASCTNKGNLTFDQDLLFQAAEFRRRVIVHELLHLKLPNHGKLFRALVRSYIANHENVEPG
jgi:predicted metal-dependent hydrolase